MLRQRAIAGLSQAKADGIQLGRRLEESDADKVAAIVAARAAGTGSDALPGISGGRGNGAACDGRRRLDRPRAAR
jgi:hypothetical protein